MKFEYKFGEVAQNFGVRAKNFKIAAIFNWLGQYLIDVVVIQHEEITVDAVG